jgi:predicted component of type VI protein secretion system
MHHRHDISDPYIEDYVLYNKFSKNAVLDFFNVFNHALFFARYLFLKKQVAECLSCPVEHSMIGKIIANLSGFSFDEKTPALPQQFKISAQNLFWRYSSSSAKINIGFFNVDVDIEQFVGNFTEPIALEYTTAIGNKYGKYNVVGKNTILGKKTWNSANGIKIHINNLSLEAYVEFLPKSNKRDVPFSKLQRMKELVKIYVPFGIGVRLVFHLKDENVFQTYLGPYKRLNKDAFIGGNLSQEDEISFSMQINT